MIEIDNNNFSVEQICESGQCFRMKPIGDAQFDVVAFGKYLQIKQSKEKTYFDCSEEEYEQLWKNYFDLDRDYGAVIQSVAGDGYLKQAVSFGSGIRILRQDLWEMIISFIVSQQNNIKRIRKIIQLLCEKFGEKKVTSQGVTYFCFPEPEALSAATDEELRACNLGYRSRYILSTSRSIAGGSVDLKTVMELDYETAREALMELSGVGKKVADCICLFALHHMDAFPIDTHIRKVLDSYYPNGFPFSRYSGYAGVLQQYIFYYDLKMG